MSPAIQAWEGFGLIIGAAQCADRWGRLWTHSQYGGETPWHGLGWEIAFTLMTLVWWTFAWPLALIWNNRVHGRMIR